MNAKELTGKSGFFLEFNKQDEKNRMFWELGAWQNLDMAVSEVVKGRGSCLAQYTFSVEQKFFGLSSSPVSSFKITISEYSTSAFL